MSETTVWQDAEGNYYAFGAEELAAAKAANGTYDMADEAVQAARVPEERREALEAALGVDEVSGFAGQPIPGIDVIVKKKKPPYDGKMTVSNVGSLSGMAPADFRMTQY